jgi:hypothetical protein
MSYRLIIRHEAEVDITDAAIRYQNQQLRVRLRASGRIGGFGFSVIFFARDERK